MKKKLSLCIAGLLCAAAAFGAVGCGGETETAGVVQLSGFETQTQVDGAVAGMAFGKRLLNTDAQYVSEGSGSMYLEVHSGKATDYSPPHIRRSSAVDFELDTLSSVIVPEAGDPYFDFSKAEWIAADFFNTGDRAVSVRLLMHTKDGYDIDFGFQVLPAGQKTTAVFTNDLDKNVNLGIDEVTGITFYFPIIEEGQTPAALYMDDLRYYRNPDVTYENQTLPEETGEAVCSFDHEYYYNTAWTTYLSGQMLAQTIPEFSRNTDPAYVTEGTASLRVKRYSLYYPTMDFGFYNYLYLPGVAEQIRKFAFEAPADANDAVTDRYELVIDVYCDYSFYIDFLFNCGPKQYQATLEPNRWNELRFNMGDLTVEQWNALDGVSLFMLDYYGPGNAELYIDNLRIQKTGA